MINKDNYKTKWVTTILLLVQKTSRDDAFDITDDEKLKKKKDVESILLTLEWI
jgi:hypothetical protein